MIDTKKVKEYIAIDIAAEYISYTDADEVADLIYEDFKDKIYSYLNINTKGDFISALIYNDEAPETIKFTENVNNYATGYVEEHLIKLTDEEFLRFARFHYDGQFKWKDVEYAS